ncbi:hypothetical protein OQA88_8472 [Cercophora sp. LCS_1]
MDSTLQIFDIKERSTSEVKPPSFPDPASSNTGFPAPKKRVSAFKRQRQAQSSNEPATAKELQQPNTTRPGGGSSQEDAATAEKRRIDEENQARLASMSPQEILEAQKDLFNALDPRLLELLLRRANLDDKPKGPDPFAIPGGDASSTAMPDPPEIEIEEPAPEPVERPSEPPRTKPKKTVTFDEDAAPSQPPDDLFPISSPPSKSASSNGDHVHPDGTTHFPAPPQAPDLDPSDPDFLENLHKKFFPSLPADPSKLAWMAPIPTENSAADRESPYYPGQDSLPVSALRFDFKGALLAPRTSRTVPVTKGLHHHGEAPEAAGYTIPELARLARSAVPSQRCIAYQTLGRMLYRLGRGEWGTGSGGRGGDEDDLAFALWRCFQEGRVLESLEEEASKKHGEGHMSSKAFATEALWLFEKGGWRERWKGR